MMLFLCIFIIAVFFSMAGLGGALLYIPLFSWFNFDIKSFGIPVALLLNSVLSMSASVTYMRAGLTDIYMALSILSTSIVIAYISGIVANYISTYMLKVLFISVMIYIFIQLGVLNNNYGTTMIRAFNISKRKRYIAGAVIGIIVGLISGILGLGGGFLLVPFFLHIGYSEKYAVANSSFVIIFSSLSGFIGHAVAGINISIMILGYSVVACILGSQLGAYFVANRLKASWIKRVFCFIILIAISRMLYEVLYYN